MTPAARTLFTPLLILAALLPAASDATATRPATPDGLIPHGLGVNIHFTDETAPGEVAQIAATGARFVRMDFSWVHVEKQPGQYDFAPYDRLLDALDRHGLRALLILDYANPLYDEDKSPYTDAGRAAFARFAAAAAGRYRGRGVIWEVYNEPNIAPFWRPAPNVDDYVALAHTTVDAVRAVDPEATVVGPACSGVDLAFLQRCFEEGVLQKFDAITVHPYRQRDPETAEEDYRALRALMRRHGAPKPVFSGEWGYSDVWVGMDRDRQARLLARQWLFNLSQGVNLSIWYDWRDDGDKPDEPEHHFGLVEHAAKPPTGDAAAAEGPYPPKPAFHAARTLTGELDGYRFSKRLWTGDARDWVLLFEKQDALKLAVWTTAGDGEARTVRIPASDGAFVGVNHLGEPLPPVGSAGGELVVTATDAPMFITPTAPNDALRLAAAWQAPPPEVFASIDDLFGHVDWSAEIANPLREPLAMQYAPFPGASTDDGLVEREGVTLAPGQSGRLRARLPIHRLARPQHAVVTLDAPGMPPLRQRLTVLCETGVEPVVRPVSPTEFRVELLNPSERQMGGFVALVDADDPSRRLAHSAIGLSDGQRFQWVFVRLNDRADETPPRAVRLRLTSPDHKTHLDLPAERFVPLTLDSTAWTIVAEGDANTASTQAIATIPAPGHPLADDAPAMRINYDFAAGWKYAMVRPTAGTLPLQARPTALGVWVKGDGSGNILRCRFVDSAGQTFQPDGPRLTFHDWRFIEFPLTGERAGHWGGDKSGVVKHPIQLDTLLLIDSHARQPTRGAPAIASPTLIYRDDG